MTQIACNMAANHGWRIAIASFEMHVRLFSKTADRLPLMKPRSQWTIGECDRCRAFIDEHFVFIACRQMTMIRRPMSSG